MPKPPFQATAEGLPTRRQFLKSTAGAAVALCAGTVTATALSNEPDPLPEEMRAEVLRFLRQATSEETALFKDLVEAMVEAQKAPSFVSRYLAERKVANAKARIEQYKAMKRAAA